MPDVLLFRSGPVPGTRRHIVADRLQAVGGTVEYRRAVVHDLIEVSTGWNRRDAGRCANQMIQIDVSQRSINFGIDTGLHGRRQITCGRCVGQVRDCGNRSCRDVGSAGNGKREGSGEEPGRLCIGCHAC